MVIEEVGAIQEHLEIERTCRESAEALASKLKRQNRSLKRKSMMMLPHLMPEQHLRASTGLLKEKHDNTILIAEAVRQKKLLGKYNRVSQFAVEEYEALQDTLDLERDLRTEAEGFARAMLVEQRKLKRQSQILMQSSSPSEALQEALSQVGKLSKELETQRLELQQQVQQAEDRLRSCEAQRELTALRRTLELVEEEKRGSTRSRICALQSRSSRRSCSSLLLLIQKRRDISTDIPLVGQDSAKTPEVDVRQQAVEEMMHRIKRGVQLRPVSQSPNRSRKQRERLPSNSAIQELKGIMENFGRASPQPKAVPPSAGGDEQLQKILLRRRGALEP
ncbi:Shootin-1 [Dissostichus eleginoides]|uniref:Shootin-1 n=1 Tax=Dissostichus eleginoides TaxID=100907 RepID=A0AAD9CPF5_DISEL|nr:Shootin-1 [Dissostichus eleginoides]